MAILADQLEAVVLGEPGADDDRQVGPHLADAPVEVEAGPVAEHHVEQPFYKRQRDRADPESLGRRAPGWQSEDE